MSLCATPMPAGSTTPTIGKSSNWTAHSWAGACFCPHDNEQPFTRSLGGVKIPAAIKKVRVRGHDKRHSYGGKQLVIPLPID